MTPEEQLEMILCLCKNAQLIEESGQKVVFLPTFTFKAGPNEITQDLLFVPFHHSGYPSRLFFSVKMSGSSARNWTNHNLLNRNWWSPSYLVDTRKSWRDQILQHIQAVVS